MEEIRRAVRISVIDASREKKMPFRMQIGRKNTNISVGLKNCQKKVDRIVIKTIGEIILV